MLIGWAAMLMVDNWQMSVLPEVPLTGYSVMLNLPISSWAQPIAGGNEMEEEKWFAYIPDNASKYIS